MTNAILGISALYHDSAVAAVKGGEIVAAAQEERFSRRKHDRRFPLEALSYCISHVGGAQQIDAVAYYEDPVLVLDRVLKNSIDLAPATEAIWPVTAESQLGEKISVVERIASIVGPSASHNIFLTDHHLSHAASAFYPSPFREAAIIVIDGVGEWATTTIADGTDRDIVQLAQLQYPHSLGLFYSAITYHCGFKVNSGEYKLMGLAPYGEPRFATLLLDNLLDLKDDGSFSLNLDYFGFLASDVSTNENFARLCGIPRRLAKDPITRAQMDLAASAQFVLDEAVLRISKTALASTGKKNLCLAGGVALNCVANGRLVKRLPDLKEIWIQPAAGDAGGAVGAALYVAHKHFGSARHAQVGYRDGQHGSLLGPSYSATEIDRVLGQACLRYHNIEDEADYNDQVAAALANGMIVGRFAGRMEFGPRALGNRSILADPRHPNGQSYINLRIKYRESWRPFAPSVLIDRVGDYFNITNESPYMLLVGDVREELRFPIDWDEFRSGNGDMLELANKRRSVLPAITHVDYSARVQTVDPERNPGFYKLLRRFFEITGCAVLVNTSFNVRGEPIVCSPEDAINCFLNSGIDLLAIDSFLVFKQEQSRETQSKQGCIQYEED